MAYRKKMIGKNIISHNTHCYIYKGHYTDDTKDTLVREIHVDEHSTPEEYRKAVEYVTQFEFSPSDLEDAWSYYPIFLFCKSTNNDFSYLKKLNVDESMFVETIKYVEKEKV